MKGSPALIPIGTGGEGDLEVTPEIAAEAAVWVARLHGPSRTNEMENEFRAWQASSPAHREAFERCTDVWQDVPRIGLATAYEVLAAERTAKAPSPGRRSEAAWCWIGVSAAAGVAAACAVFVLRWHGEDDYITNVGEQRLVVLDDGSRMLLNTCTQLRVDFSAAQRAVEVRSGEAFFDVAKDSRRPFVVRVAGSEVVAVGTEFSVRYAPGDHASEELTVTLVEGRVNVRPSRNANAEALEPAQPVSLKTGDRLSLGRAPHAHAASTAVRIDHPNVNEATAWRRGEIAFDQALLSDAVAEINRYNRTPVVLIDGLASSDLRISGLYRTSDSAGFANAVAALHGLQLRERDGRLELAKPNESIQPALPESPD